MVERVQKPERRRRVLVGVAVGWTAVLFLWVVLWYAGSAGSLLFGIPVLLVAAPAATHTLRAFRIVCAAVLVVLVPACFLLAMLGGLVYLPAALLVLIATLPMRGFAGRYVMAVLAAAATVAATIMLLNVIG